MKHGLLLLLMFAGTATAADALPEFHGIRLGSMMTKEQVMHALGADQFKVDPVINLWTPETSPDVNKYGPDYMVEKVEFEIGPFCRVEGPKKFYCFQPCHSCISRALLAGIPIAHVAKNAGTSVAMIERFYGSHLTSEMSAERFINQP